MRFTARSGACEAEVKTVELFGSAEVAFPRPECRSTHASELRFDDGALFPLHTTKLFDYMENPSEKVNC